MRNMFNRPFYLNQILKFKDTDFIKILTGVRRSGKSFLMKLYKQHLENLGVKSENIIYINFESYESLSINNEEKFRAEIDKRLPDNNNKLYFMFDEIQLVEGWQRVVNGLKTSFDSDITITGSNADMLSGELATLLSGRYVEILVYPLSFSEFIQVKELNPDSRYVDQAYLEYEKYGGFPSVVLADEEIKDVILQGIFDTIVLNDIAFRAGVKDPATLKALISFLSDNVGLLVNSARIANTLTSEGVPTTIPTIKKYLDLLETGYLFYRGKQYDIRGREYLRTNGKYFIVDSGLRRNAVGRKDGNYSNRLENIVFIELKRRGYQVDIGRLGTKEIDFIARKLDEVLYVQVTYDLPNNTHETDNLNNINDNYKKVLVTGRYQQVKQIDGIDVKYIVDWLLEENN